MIQTNTKSPGVYINAEDPNPSKKPVTKKKKAAIKKLKPDKFKTRNSGGRGG
jgi:hypothetical protein